MLKEYESTVAETSVNFKKEFKQHVAHLKEPTANHSKSYFDSTGKVEGQYFDKEMQLKIPGPEFLHEAYANKTKNPTYFPSN